MCADGADSTMCLVVAAVIVDDLAAPTAMLAARRNQPPALAGKWELPGGKVEPGESPVDALARELQEELRIEVEIGAELPGPAGGLWPISTTFAMRVWLVRVARGTPGPAGAHDATQWLSWSELSGCDWLDADLAIAQQLTRRFGMRTAGP